MQKNSIIISIISLLFIFTSCDPLEREHGRVMDLHDESMLKMSELANCMKTLEQDSSEMSQNVFTELKQAEDDMWKWMHNYDEPGEAVSKEVKLKYYAEQYESIKKVNNEIDLSIAKAKQITN